MNSIYNKIIAGLLILIAGLALMIMLERHDHPSGPKGQPGPATDDPSPPDRKAPPRVSYYIDSETGDNRNTGKTAQHPWKDFTRLPEKTIPGGATILLKRGGIWHQPFTCPSGDTPQTPVVVTAWGEGPDPVIDLEKKHPQGFIIKGSNVSVSHITIMNTLKNGIPISSGGIKENIRLFGITTRNIGQNAIAVFRGGAHITIINCRLINSGNNGIYLGGSEENKLHHVRVSNCHISGVKGNDGITIHRDGQKNTAGAHFIIEDNYAENCREQGYDITTGEHVLLINNVSRKNGAGGIVVGHTAHDVTITGHTSLDEPTTTTSAAINILTPGPANVRVFNSLIKGAGHHLISVSSSQVAIVNNTFIPTGKSYPLDFARDLTDIVFMNNILSSKNGLMRRIRFLNPSRPPGHTSFSFDHNIYHANNKDVIFYHDRQNYPFASYQTHFTTEMNSRQIDPKLITEDGKERISPDSPARGAGGYPGRILSQTSENRFLTDKAYLSFSPFDENLFQSIRIKGIKGEFKITRVQTSPPSITLSPGVTITQETSFSPSFKGDAPSIRIAKDFGMRPAEAVLPPTY